MAQVLPRLSFESHRSAYSRHATAMTAPPAAFAATYQQLASKPAQQRQQQPILASAPQSPPRSAQTPANTTSSSETATATEVSIEVTTDHWTLRAYHLIRDGPRCGFVVFAIDKRQHHLYVVKMGNQREYMDLVLEVLPDERCRYLVYKMVVGSEQSGWETRLVWIVWTPSMVADVECDRYQTGLERVFEGLQVTDCVTVEASSKVELSPDVIQALF